MNSKRIIEDLDFVEQNREINTRNNLSDDEAYKMRKLYTIYLTIYDMYYMYNNDDCNFDNLETEYKRAYNKNAIEMIKKTDINTILIHNYAYHMESLKRLQKLHYEKAISELMKVNDTKPEISKNMIINTEPKNNLFNIIFSITVFNLFIINIITFLIVYKIL